MCALHKIIQCVHALVNKFSDSKYGSNYVFEETDPTQKTAVLFCPIVRYCRAPSRPVFLDRGASSRLQPDMAKGGGDQVWTWKKRKTVAASRAAAGEEMRL